MAKKRQSDSQKMAGKTISHLDRQASRGGYRVEDEPFFAAFQGIVERNSRLIYSPNAFEYGVPEHFPIPDELRIAVISFSMKKGLFNVYRPPENDGMASTLKQIKLSVPTSEGKRYLDQMMSEELSRLVPNSPDLVCFHELAFPHGTRGVKRFLNRLLKKFDKKPQILAGSLHCKETWYNLAIYQAGDRIAKHPKRISATRKEERVLLPADRRLHLYDTSLGRVGILVCLDVFDASQVLSAVRQNLAGTEREHVPILLVPAFRMTDVEKFLSACKDLSFLMGNAVVVAHSDYRSHDQHVFLGGLEAGIDRDAECEVLQVSEFTKLFTISAEAYWKNRKRAVESIPNAVKAAFGRPLTDEVTGFGVLTR